MLTPTYHITFRANDGHRHTLKTKPMGKRDAAVALSALWCVTNGQYDFRRVKDTRTRVCDGRIAPAFEARPSIGAAPIWNASAEEA